MNRVTLIGRLVRDVELRYTQSNQAVANFTLAVDRRMSRERRQEAESQNRPTADFIRINVWGPQAVNCERYLGKGSQCAVEGRIQTGSYQDRETGKTVYTTDVVADSVEFLGSRSDREGSGYRPNYGDNQDLGNNNYSQTGYQNNNNNNSYNQNPSGFDSNDDFFDDDFTEIEDDGRIPF